jgi:hypothetical protein
MRRPVPLIAVASQVSIAKIICKNENKVRTLGSGGDQYVSQ